jgi:CheY-like chemotaxis protein/HPt (histidine-containing phosphotransfer) domain-containing protein
MNEGTERFEDDAKDSQRARIPRVLLVEDDAVGAAFMTDAIAVLPADVAHAATLAEAIRMAAARAFDLYLIDAHLPDGFGSELLAKLRAQGRHEPAVAHTAETASSVLDALIDAGFEEVLIKPLSVGALQGTVRRFAGHRFAEHRFADSAQPYRAETGAAASRAADPSPSDRGAPTDGKLALWDDDAALRALNGNHTHVALMRKLFRGELPQQAQRIAAALDMNDHERARAELHKLLASTGFVGAARLAEHTRALQTRTDSAHARFQFEGTVRDTLNSLTDQGTLSSD